LQHINILDSEKRQAESMIPYYQNVVDDNNGTQDPVIRKLNFSGCLKNNESAANLKNPKIMTTPSSPVRMNLGPSQRQSPILKMTNQNSQQPMNPKCRSRNPSCSGLKIATTSIPLRNIGSSTMFKEMRQSGQLKTLKQLATARNISSTANLNNQNRQHNRNKSEWFEDNLHSNNELGHTNTSGHSQYMNAGNPYKRGNKSKGEFTSEEARAINFISEIHPSSKEQSEDVNGTLMNSIVNLFPNKFKSKNGSNYNQNEQSHSHRNSLSKHELEDKLQRIKRSRENSNFGVSAGSNGSQDWNEKETPDLPAYCRKQPNRSIKEKAIKKD
jgi:hypothetical protein